MKDELEDLKKKIENGSNLMKDAAILLRKDRKLEKEEIQNILKRAKKLRDE